MMLYIFYLDTCHFLNLYSYIEGSNGDLKIAAKKVLNDYNNKSGSTVVLPFSHRLESMPSKKYVEKNQVSLIADAGSVIVFNSWLYHRAGLNKSGKVRTGINHLYAIPFIRQQIDIPRLLNGKFRDDPQLHKVLGYKWETPISVDEWRQKRL